MMAGAFRENSMPQTYNVGSRSRFVNFIAWMFILLGAFACEWAVIQNASQSSWTALAGDQSSLPWLTGLLMRHATWVFTTAVALSLATMVCAIGLLRRIEWARRVFIGLLMVAIVVDLAGPISRYIQNSALLLQQHDWPIHIAQATPDLLSLKMSGPRKLPASEAY